MLRELITWILNTYLGNYLEDFNPAQLSVALLSGEVELDNIPIRRDALRSFGIPVQVLSGIIGKIKLQIPVRQFRSAPWCIVIEQVYAVFSPKRLEDWDDDYERMCELDFKMSELNSKEAVWRAQRGQNSESCYYASSYSNWLHYGTSLATNIIENLELKLNNVHIRFEDTITIPEQHFASGFQIDSLTVNSCDSSWETGSKSQAKDIAYKLIELKNFAMYWDKLTNENTCANFSSKDLLQNMKTISNIENHNFIINPITARAQCKRERCKLALQTKTRPRLSCNVFLSELKIMLTDMQYQQIIGCYAGLQNIRKIRAFKILRPTSHIKGNARSWWIYAAGCHGFIFETKTERLHKLRENLRYIKIYNKMLLNSNENIAKEDREFKSNMEKFRTLEELLMLRNLCYNNSSTPEFNFQSTKAMKGKSMLYHWFPNWWGWYGKSNSEVCQSQKQYVADEENFENIEDEILNALENSVGNNSYIKRDVVFGYFDLKLEDGKFVMFSENVKMKLFKIMMEMNFQTLNLMVETRPRSDSYFIGLSMGSVCVIDHITQATEYPILIKPQAKENILPLKYIPSLPKSNTLQSSQENDFDLQVAEPWFQLQYEKRPICCSSDFRLFIKSKSLDIVYNTFSYQWFINFITTPLKDDIFTQQGRKNKNPIIKSWKNLLVENMELRKSWSFEIDIATPQIIFVDNFVDKNSIIMLIDFGRFQLLKNCPDPKIKNENLQSMKFEVLCKDSEILTDDEDMFMTPCSTPPGSENSPLESGHFSSNLVENSKTIINNTGGLEKAFHEKIYDKYTIDLTDLQVLICRNSERSFASLKGSTGFHLLDKFDISLELERRIIYTLDPDFPSLTIAGTLPNILIHVNDHKINAVMDMLFLYSKTMENDMKRSCKFGNYENDKTLSSSETSNNASRPNDSNLIKIKFLVDQLTLEIQSENRSIAELQVIGVRAGLIKKPEDTFITMSVHGLLFVDAIQSFGQDFELLVASHRNVGMDSISGSLKQSQPCSPLSPSSPDPMVYKRPTSPQTIKEAINLIKTENRYVTSLHQNSDALIIVELHLIKQTDEGEALHVANIHFNNLDIIANQETVAELIGFIDRIIYFHKRSREHFEKTDDTKKINEFKSHGLFLWPFEKQTEINFDFHRLNVLVLRESKKDNFTVGRKVGTFTMSEAKIHASLGEEICVSGSLGGMQILDVTPEGINHQRILSVGKDPLTDTSDEFQEDLLNTLTRDVYGNSSSNKQKSSSQEALTFQIVRCEKKVLNIKIRMASVWYTHCVRFITEINLCAFQFKNHLKNFAQTIRNKATDMAIEFVQKIHDQTKFVDKNRDLTNDILNKESKSESCCHIELDAILSSPVLILPRSSHSTEVLVANLGKISMYNAEEEYIGLNTKVSDHNQKCANSGRPFYSYIIDIKNINLFSLDTSHRKKESSLPKVEEFYSCERDAIAILHDTALKLELNNNINISEKRNKDPDAEILNIKGYVTQLLKVSLSRIQYEQLLESLNNAIKDTLEIAPQICTVKTEDDSKCGEMHSSKHNKLLKENNLKSHMFCKISFSLPVLVIALNNEHQNPLIEITFQKFVINYNNLSKMHTNLEVLLGSIIMEDLKCPVDSNHRHMVDSTPYKECKLSKMRVSTSCPSLSKSSYSNLQTTSMPDNLQYATGTFLNGYNFESSTKNSFNGGIKRKECISDEGVSTCDENLVTYIVQIFTSQESNSMCAMQTVSTLDFNSLNLIISLDRWLVVLDFFGLLSESEDNNRAERNKIEQNTCNETGNYLLNISVRSLNLVMVRMDNELAKINVSNALFILKKSSEYQIIDGCLGSISLFDLTKYGKFYSEKFLTSGKEALNFHYKRRTSVLELGPLEQDAILQIQMSSVRYIHTNRFILEIQSFIKEFVQFQKPVIKKIKLSDRKTERDQRPMKIGLDIKAESPIILLPLCFESNDLIVADLGKFSLSNSFNFANENVVNSTNIIINYVIDVMQVDLVNINLFIGKRVAAENDLRSYNFKQSFNVGLFHVSRCGNNIFQEKCYLKLRIERNIEAFKSNDVHNIPDVSIKGTLSKVSCILSLQQYKVIRGFLAFNLGEDVDDVYHKYSLNLCEPFGKVNSKPEVNDRFQCVPIWKVLSIKMELENVSVHLNIQKVGSKDYVSLACINFIKSLLEIDSFSDGSQDIDLVSSEILITDSRYGSPFNEDKHPNNVFFEIIKPIHSVENVVQAEVHSRRCSESIKYKVLLNNMRIMAILDWMLCVKDYISENTEFKVKKTNNVKPFKTSDKRDETFGDSTLKIIINITDSELVFVEKTNEMDTNSIILKSTTVISYKPYEHIHPLSVDINHLEVFSCILGLEHESALSIIDPVTLNVELQNNQLDILLQKNFCIRLSYHDVKLFLKMLNSIKAQTQAAQDKQLNKNQTKIDFEIIAPLIAMGFKPKDCLYAMEISNNKLNDAALWLSQQKKAELNSKSLNVLSISICAQFVSVCVIDDCKDADVPLLEISLSRLSLLHKLKERSENSIAYVPKLLSGKLEAVISVDYFNRRLSGWEPIIEPWECITSWISKTDVQSKQSSFNFTIISSQLLKLNITSTLIELYKLVRNNWTQDYYEGISNVKSNTISSMASNYRQRIPFVPFLLKNLSGEMLSFKIISSQPGKLTRMEISQKDLINDWIQVKPNETVPFKFGPQSKMRHMNSHKLNLHQILVSIAGWDMIGPVSIDKVGTFFRYSTEEKFVRRNRIVFDISLMGSAQKMIKVRSALRVVNMLNICIELMLGKQDQTYTIKSKDCFCVPLNQIGSQIRVKPCNSGVNEDRHDKRLDSQFQFCKPGISCLKNTKDLSEELCVCSGTNGGSFNILAVIKRDKYPNGDLMQMPGHTISFVTPLKITNMLCCDLLFKISGHIAGRIHASETANIYNINIHDAIHIRFTLDNYTICGILRIPSNHSGSVEPKLKLLDLNNRELFLRASIQLLTGKGMEIYISAPVWLVNRTGLPLIYRQEGILHLASGQFEEHEKARNITPLMFSFSDPEAAPSLEIRLGKRFGENNPWCKSFSLHKEIIFRELQEGNARGSYAIGIEIRRGSGRYSCTNIVTVAPRFQLYNRSSHEIQFAQKCDVLTKDYSSFDTKLLTAIPGCHFPFHWPNCDQEPILCLRLVDVENCQWSSGIRINEVQSLYINVRNNSGNMFFLRLEVISHAASYFLIFGDAHSLPPPIRIDNYSDVQINFFQQGCKPQWRTSVRPHYSLAYVLDDPTGYQCLVIEAPGGNSIEFPLHKLEFSRSLTYSNFIYIAFKETFMQNVLSQNNKRSGIDIENQQLVLGVKGKKVILLKKCTGDRSQLWLMNSCGQLEHEGSSPPIIPGKYAITDESRMVLDLEKPPNPMDYTNVVIRPPNKQRQTTQTWRFDHGRLMCHANLCVQTRNGVFGLFEGAEVVLGRMESESRAINKNRIPIEQSIERQKLRPGSGHLQIISKMDGPILTIQIRDIKTKIIDECLSPDPLWKHTSTIVKKKNNESTTARDFSIKCELNKGVGISLISRQPCEELVFITLQNIIFEYIITSIAKSLDLKVNDIQIDNQLIDTPCPVLLYTSKSTNNECVASALVLNAKMLQSLNENAVIIENVTLSFKPYAVVLDERHILKMAIFFGYGKEENQLPKNIKSEYEAHYFEKQILTLNSKRYYFENLYIGSCQIRLSVCTATKLSQQLYETKKSLGLSLIKFEDALIIFDQFTERHHFETIDVYLSVIKLHYKNQIKWHAGSILGSVDFLGNPLGLANDVSEGVSGLIFEGSVKSLVRNLTHGISNSTAKLTETLSDSLGRVVLDDSDTETRQKILEITSGQGSSTSHLAAGLKGFGFGLLGGVTSIVRQTYVGAQTDGLHGFISGLGKGLVGTVTKPIIGVLDLAAETATAVRETSRGSNRTLPSRKRWPRCVTGAPGGLLPQYSYRQSKGQQYLYMINRKNLSEHLISYEPNLCNDRDSKLRLLVSTEYVRIFSRCEEDPSIVLDCHLSEVLSCHPLTTGTGSYDTSIKPKPSYYIEISTNLPKITRPRIRCQNMEIAEKASRYINYAKSVYDEREQTVANE